MLGWVSFIKIVITRETERQRLNPRAEKARPHGPALSHLAVNDRARGPDVDTLSNWRAWVDPSVGLPTPKALNAR
jgi:hypothetical protein